MSLAHYLNSTPQQQSRFHQNKKVKHFTHISLVLAKIILHNIHPKSGEYSHARRCALLFIYGLQEGIQVNIPKQILDYMLSIIT